jgi:hypothetical protein
LDGDKKCTDEHSRRDYAGICKKRARLASDPVAAQSPENRPPRGMAMRLAKAFVALSCQF